MFSRPADEYRQVAILPAIVAPFREQKGHLMINTLPRRRFLKGAVTTGAVCLFGAPLSATNNSPHWLAVYPLSLSEPILQKLHVGRPGEVESCETFRQPRSVTAFHTGFTGRISPPASPTGTHDFYCALYTDTEAYTSGFSRVPGWPWWQATKSEPVRAITIVRPPAGLSRAEAAKYVGVSPTTFDLMVADGQMPSSLPLSCRRKIWNIRALDGSLDKLAGIDGGQTELATPSQPLQNADEWCARLRT